MKELKNFVNLVAEYYNRQLSVNQLRMYCEDLKNYSVSGLGQAWKIYKSDPERKFFPLPGDLKKFYKADHIPAIEFNQDRCVYCDGTSVLMAKEKNKNNTTTFECGFCGLGNRYEENYNRLKEENPGFKKPKRKTVWGKFSHQKLESKFELYGNPRSEFFKRNLEDSCDAIIFPKEQVARMTKVINQRITGEIKTEEEFDKKLWGPNGYAGYLKAKESRLGKSENWKNRGASQN